MAALGLLHWRKMTLWVTKMKPLEQENATLRERIARLEAQLAEKSSQANPNPTPSGNHTRFDTLFETMELGVVYQDAEGAITQANPAAHQRHGA